MARVAWLKSLKLKDLFTDDDVGELEAQRIGKIVAERIRAHPCFGYENEDYASQFEEIFNQDEFNDLLDELYDAADEYRVWIE